MLLWLWYRPAAVAPVRPLAWEPLHAGAALKSKRKGIVFSSFVLTCIGMLNMPTLGAQYSLGSCPPEVPACPSCTQSLTAFSLLSWLAPCKGCFNPASQFLVPKMHPQLCTCLYTLVSKSLLPTLLFLPGFTW